MEIAAGIYRYYAQRR